MVQTELGFLWLDSSLFAAAFITEWAAPGLTGAPQGRPEQGMQSL